MSSLRRLLVVASFAAFSLPALANPVVDYAGGPRIALRQDPAVVTTMAPTTTAPTTTAPSVHPTTGSGARPTSPPVAPNLVSECIDAGIPADREFSLYSYSIIMDQASRDAAAAAGLDTVAVRQHCDACNAIDCSTTENWGMVPLDKFHPDRYIDVVVDRCKKNNSRYVDKYRILLCRGFDQDNCEEFCGDYRYICLARDADGNILKSRLVNDLNPWTCAVPGI